MRFVLDMSVQIVCCFNLLVSLGQGLPSSLSDCVRACLLATLYFVCVGVANHVTMFELLVLVCVVSLVCYACVCWICLTVWFVVCVFC